MIRGALLVLVMFALGVLVAPFAVEAQQAGRVYRLGTFDLTKSPSMEANAPFMQALRELGWVEGQNLVVERRYAAAPEHLPSLVAELVRLNVDVIVVRHRVRDHEPVPPRRVSSGAEPAPG